MKHILIVAAAILVNTSIFAQGKIGHLDGNKLLESMPDVKAAIDSVNKQNDMYLEYINSEEKKIQEDIAKYQQEGANLPETIRASKENAILARQQGLEDFKQQASSDLEKLQRDLLEGPTERAKKAIEDVAKEGGYTYIFDSGVQTILYAGGDDIIDKVKTKLGIPLEAPKPAPQMPKK